MESRTRCLENMVSSTMDFLTFYKGKKVFLTGHTGFKGSWLLYWLHQLGAEVKGYALAPQSPDDLYVSMEGDHFCDSVIADIRDKERLEKELLAFQPDIVFHLAAQPLVRLSYEIPSETFTVNAIGTAHVLDALHKLQKPCVGVMITTDKVYENKEWHYPYRENDRLGGYDPYSASKACAELVIDSYRNSFFHMNNYSSHQKAIAVARAGNVIGGGDWATDRLIPDIIRSLSKKEPVMVRNPFSVRPWQHVLEPLSGYLLLASKLVDHPEDISGAWNFGPAHSDNLTVEALVRIAIDAWGEGSYEKPEILNQPHEADLLKLDISKVMAELKWSPKWSAQQAIGTSMKWYRDYLAGKKATELMDNDINQFLMHP